MSEENKRVTLEVTLTDDAGGSEGDFLSFHCGNTEFTPAQRWAFASGEDLLELDDGRKYRRVENEERPGNIPPSRYMVYEEI